MLLQVRSLACGALPFRRAKLKANSAPTKGRADDKLISKKDCLVKQGWGLLTLGRDLLPAATLCSYPGLWLNSSPEEQRGQSVV